MLEELNTLIILPTYYLHLTTQFPLKASLRVGGVDNQMLEELQL